MSCRNQELQRLFDYLLRVGHRDVMSSPLQDNESDVVLAYERPHTLGEMERNNVVVRSLGLELAMDTIVRVVYLPRRARP